MEDIKQIAKDAKNTYLKMMNLSCDLKNSILKKIANALEEKKSEILEKNKIDIDSAKIIVAGGKGMKNQAGFELLKILAQKLGATVGASRGAVDMGLAPVEIQIGQTGKTVSPKLYIACGISGAIQHTVGMCDSDKVIAINKDPNAPIFEVSDIGYVGDLFEALPELIKSLN